jgi:hypothetical protein
MSPEEKELLEKSVKLGEENNKMLRALYRSMRTRRLMSIVYWVFIIGSLVGAWYFVQPLIDQVVGAYGGAQSNLQSFSEFFKNMKK